MTREEHSFTAVKLFLPAIFLLVLGLGNIAVGSFKQQQYEEVLKELRLGPSDIALVNVSPMRRIQLNRRSEDRNIDRLKQAQVRRDLYHLVILGGTSMVAVGSVLLLATAIFSYRRSRDLKLID